MPLKLESGHQRVYEEGSICRYSHSPQDGRTSRQQQKMVAKTATSGPKIHVRLKQSLTPTPLDDRAWSVWLLLAGGFSTKESWLGS